MHAEEKVEELVQQLEVARYIYYKRRMVGRISVQAEEVEHHPVNAKKPNKPRLHVHKNQQQWHKIKRNGLIIQRVIMKHAMNTVTVKTSEGQVP